MLLLRDLPKYECIRAKAAKYPQVDPSAIQSCLVLMRVASDVLARLEAYLAAHGLSQGRFTVLMLLSRDDPPASASDLACKAGVTRATMTGLLDGLQREGLIERLPNDKDRRVHDVRLTDDGRALLDAMLPGYFSLVSEVMGPLEEDSRAGLLELLTRIREGMSRDEPEATLTSDAIKVSAHG